MNKIVYIFTFLIIPTMVFCASPEKPMIKLAKELTDVERSATETATTSSGTSTIAMPTNTPVTGPSTIMKRTYKSLMFTGRNVEELNKILPKFMGNKNISPLDRLNLEEEAKFTANNITNENDIFVYLNSIMYISKNSWSVWVNGSKITNMNNREGEISVTKISPLSASFVWNIDLNKWNVINADKQIPESKYKVQDDKVSLYFTLSPNQTYLPITNRIIEGNISPKSVMEAEAQKDKGDQKNNDEISPSMKDDFAF